MRHFCGGCRNSAVFSEGVPGITGRRIMRHGLPDMGYLDLDVLRDAVYDTDGGSVGDFLLVYSVEGLRIQQRTSFCAVYDFYSGTGLWLSGRPLIVRRQFLEFGEILFVICDAFAKTETSGFGVQSFHVFTFFIS